MYPHFLLTFNCNRVLKYSSAFQSNAQIIDNHEFCLTVTSNFVHDCSKATGGVGGRLKFNNRQGYH